MIPYFNFLIETIDWHISPIEKSLFQLNKKKLNLVVRALSQIMSVLHTSISKEMPRAIYLKYNSIKQTSVD